MQFCGTHRKNCRTRKKPVNALQNRLSGKEERITENFAVEPRCVRQKCRNYAGSSVPAHCGAGKNIKWWSTRDSSTRRRVGSHSGPQNGQNEPHYHPKVASPTCG